MNWKLVNSPVGCKLFKSHHFTAIYAGKTYSLEIDEYVDGKFTGHGEQTTDESTVLTSVTSSSLEDCLNTLLKNIEKKG